QNRVLRGGSWINHPQNLRAANRNNQHPDIRNDNNGLRLAGALKIVVNTAGCSLNQLLDTLHFGGQKQGPRHVSR
ncbi:MAG: SUMF1/EgtB/PvdO family nonheme iron enzyme, partial [Gammaproteobacteria bacterium]|nr:SUMF1/EgtB/PvdO family nonheme iron enzyme [Gammaproteobacteria bacterium]